MTKYHSNRTDCGIDIELGWPAKALSPNFRSRSHWPKTRALAAAKKEGFFAALAVDGKLSGGSVEVLVTAYPPTAHTRDRDNLLSSLKGHLDGIAKAFKVDDSIFDPRVQWAEPVKNGRVVITVYAA